MRKRDLTTQTESSNGSVLTEKNLKSYLNRAESELNRGEHVKVELTAQLHSMWLDFQLGGYFPDLMCVKSNDSYWLARVR